MRSAAYKALQERATRTVCSQATLHFCCLADIQFFQSLPEWHGVKFVAHHLCPHSLVTACTLWHSKQSNPNLLPALEIRRGEGPWNADRSIWCFVKTEVPDHRYEENENQPLENLQVPERGQVRNVVDGWRLGMCLCFWLTPRGPWVGLGIIPWQAGLHSSACGGAPAHLWNLCPHDRPRRSEGQSSQGTVQILHLTRRSKARGCPALPGYTGCICDSLSLCGPADHTEEFGLLTLLLCSFTSCVGSCLEHPGTGRDAELLRKQSLGSQRGTTQSYRGKLSHKTPVVSLNHPGKRFGLHCVKIYFQQRSLK